MALTIPSPGHSKLYLFGTGDFWTDPLSSSVSMTSMMSHQYPPLLPLSTEMDMTPPGYVPGYTVPSQQLYSLNTFNVHDQRMSSQKRNMNPKATCQTPDAGPLQPSEPDGQQQQMSTSAEKKRNKLGYHRTSVACGHCRRRKIRCVPAPLDAQGRCINCIRLKKDCSFYPVDQATSSDTRSKQSSRSSAGPNGTSTSSSPATSISIPAEHPKSPFSPTRTQAKPAPASKPIKITNKGGFPVKARLSLVSSAHNQAFEMNSQNPPDWLPADACQSPTSKTGELSPTWRSYPSEISLGAQLSQFTPAPSSSAGWTSGSSESASREDMAWGQYSTPVRSMSFGGEPMSGHHPSQYPPIPSNRQFERRASTLSDVYASSIGGVSGFEAGIGSDLGAASPLSAGVFMPLSNLGSWDQSQTHPNYTYCKAPDLYGVWPLGDGGRGQLQTSDTSQQLASNGSSTGIY
ncbi:hypothetical protein FZEAL_7009 [Fusarium zealandicum]|uniref:Zn(2)-C6 fungal-type domain-containing protein n=1 Tax=Fusarium zealandicum TaxID=1053134 RepID=A0A8H4XJ15_9HYPO|nr:hypothetical protein FZEAL_7009 [Fusarium zealandicum]